MIKIKSGLEMRYFAAAAMFIFLLTSAISVFAEEPRTKKGFTYNLKRLIDEAKKTVKKIDDELEKEEIEKRNRQREAMVKEHFEKGETLYREGKPKEAKKELLEAIRITKDPEMKSYIRNSERSMRKEELARRKEEEEGKRRLKAERKEEERLERERQRQLEKQRKVEERKKEEEAKKQKEEQKRLEAEKEKTEKRHKKRLKKEKTARLKKAKEKAKGIKKDLKLRLKGLPFRTTEECLVVLGKNPKDKKAFDNLVELSQLVNKHLKKGKTLYKKRKWKEAITEYRKALAIDPDNKDAIYFIKKANAKLKRLKNK